MTGSDKLSWFDWGRGIGPGNILNAAILIFAAGVGYATFTGQLSVLSDKITQVSSRIDSVQSSISNLPTESATIGVIQQQQSQTLQNIGTINSEIRDLTNQVIQNKADIENIERSSSIPLKRR